VKNGTGGGSTKNDSDASSVVVNVLITVVDTETTVTADDAIYDGNPHGATAVTTPGGAVGSMAFTYSGTGDTDYGPTSAAPTNAGTYHVVAAFTPTNPLDFNPSSDEADYTIAKAPVADTYAAHDEVYSGLHGHAGTSYDVVTTVPGDENHLNSLLTTTITITQAPLSYTIGDATHVYGSTATLAPVTLDGVNGETLTLTLSSLGNTVTANVDYYAITGVVSDGTGLASDYAVALTDGDLEVTKAALSVQANNDSKTYDNVAYSGGNGVTYDGFVNGETPAVLGGAVVYGGSSQGALTPGSYGITASGLTSDNYEIGYVAGTLSINLPNNLFKVDTQDALNVAKQGSITATVTALSANDYDTLLALSGGAFRYHFVNNATQVSVNLDASLVAGSYTGIGDANLTLTAQNNTAAMTALVSPMNTSASTSAAVTMTVQVNVGGIWYDLGSDSLKTFLSKK
jgi:hypothetical protein